MATNKAVLGYTEDLAAQILANTSKMSGAIDIEQDDQEGQSQQQHDDGGTRVQVDQDPILNYIQQIFSNIQKEIDRVGAQ